jgi:hypothetical protein
VVVSGQVAEVLSTADCSPGAALPGVPVTLKPAAVTVPPQPTQQATTGADGQFQFQANRGSSYTITVPPQHTTLQVKCDSDAQTAVGEIAVTVPSDPVPLPITGLKFGYGR